MGAFLNCKKLNRVSLSENSELREIPIKAFESTSIKEIKLPPHIIKICDDAFYNFSSIELIDIPKNSELREIGSTSFRCIKAKYIYLPKQLTKINDSAFVFKIPPHIKTINYDDFLRCRVVSL